MDHFSTEGTCVWKQNQAAQAKQHSRQDSGGFTKEQIEMWGEPQVDSSGKVTTKLPPMPAMKYLADPSPENAKAYMEWNARRMQAIEKAQALLQTMPGTSPQAQTISDIRDIKSVDFFFSPT
jgi:hypothetical protein